MDTKLLVLLVTSLILGTRLQVVADNSRYWAVPPSCAGTSCGVLGNWNNQFSVPNAHGPALVPDSVACGSGIFGGGAAGSGQPGQYPIFGHNAGAGSTSYGQYPFFGAGGAQSGFNGVVSGQPGLGGVGSEQPGFNGVGSGQSGFGGLISGQSGFGGVGSEQPGFNGVVSGQSGFGGLINGQSGFGGVGSEQPGFGGYGSGTPGFGGYGSGHPGFGGSFGGSGGFGTNELPSGTNSLGPYAPGFGLGPAYPSATDYPSTLVSGGFGTVQSGEQPSGYPSAQIVPGTFGSGFDGSIGGISHIGQPGGSGFGYPQVNQGDYPNVVGGASGSGQSGSFAFPTNQFPGGFLPGERNPGPAIVNLPINDAGFNRPADLTFGQGGHGSGQWWGGASQQPPINIGSLPNVVSANEIGGSQGGEQYNYDTGVGHNFRPGLGVPGILQLDPSGSANNHFPGASGSAGGVFGVGSDSGVGGISNWQFDPSGSPSQHFPGASHLPVSALPGTLPGFGTSQQDVTAGGQQIPSLQFNAPSFPTLSGLGDSQGGSGGVGGINFLAPGVPGTITNGIPGGAGEFGSGGINVQNPHFGLVPGNGNGYLHEKSSAEQSADSANSSEEEAKHHRIQNGPNGASQELMYQKKKADSKQSYSSKVQHERIHAGRLF